MYKLILALCVVFMLAFGVVYADESESEKAMQQEQLELEKQRLAFEREKWEYEKAQKAKEEFEAQYPANCDYKRDIPTYEFTGYVSDTERQGLLKFLMLLEEQGQKMVRINISSFGGAAFDGMGVADTIESYKRKGFKIIAVAYGKIASAAVPVFVSCSERIAGRSTLFMVHEASIFKFFTSESKSDIEAQNEMMKKLEKSYINMLVSNSKMPYEHWEAMIKKETWFMADEALEWGLVDRIE